MIFTHGGRQDEDGVAVEEILGRACCQLVLKERRTKFADPKEPMERSVRYTVPPH